MSHDDEQQKRPLQNTITAICFWITGVVFFAQVIYYLSQYSSDWSTITSEELVTALAMGIIVLVVFSFVGYGVWSSATWTRALLYVSLVFYYLFFSFAVLATSVIEPETVGMFEIVMFIVPLPVIWLVRRLTPGRTFTT